jgi:hemoglobin-like flavoprotein
MTPRQVALVQDSWLKIKPIGAAAAELFYDRLFTLDPALKPLFKGDMNEQGRKLIAMIGFVVQGLSRLDHIVPGVQALGRRHAGYGVTDGHYATVGSALLWTLAQGLGKDFTPDLQDAWTEAYTLLAMTMKDASRTEEKQAA